MPMMAVVIRMAMKPTRSNVGSLACGPLKKVTKGSHASTSSHRAEHLEIVERTRCIAMRNAVQAFVFLVQVLDLQLAQLDFRRCSFAHCRPPGHILPCRLAWDSDNVIRMRHA